MKRYIELTMKGQLLRVIAAFAVMAGTMALAGQTHQDRDHDRDNMKKHTVVHHQTVHKDRDSDKDDQHVRHMNRRTEAFSQRIKNARAHWRNHRRHHGSYWGKSTLTRHYRTEHIRYGAHPIGDHDSDRDERMHHNRGLHKGWVKGKGNPHHGGDHDRDDKGHDKK